MAARTLGSEELADLAAYLKTRDFPAGTEQILDAQRLLWRLADRGIAKSADEMAPWLGPIFSTSAAELERFNRLYGEWHGGPPPSAPSQRRRSRALWLAAVAVSLAVSMAAVAAGVWWWRETHRTQTDGKAGAPVSHEPGEVPDIPASAKLDGLEPAAIPTGPASLSGVLQGDDGKPVSGAILLYGGKSRKADAKGAFFISGQAPQPVLAIDCNYDAVLFPLINGANVTIQMARKPKNGCVGKPSVADPRPVYQLIRWIAAALPLLAFLVWTAWVLWKRAGLRKWRGVSNPEFAQVPAGVPEMHLFRETEVQRGVQELRRPKPVPVSDIWPERTVSATVENAGWFTPVYLARRRAPEYLVLIDRAGKRDQQAHLADELLKRLKERSVFAEVYHFNSDPRTCIEPATGRRVTLPDLAARYGHCEVWLVADGASFFSGFTGRMERWLEMFQMWPARMLLTPAAPSEWGERERRLADFGFQIIPATPRGLARIIDPAAVLELSPDWYPTLLQSNSYRWTGQEPPPSLDIARLCTELRLYLDAEGFRWLSASAVYPVIEWPLTLYLGEALTQPENLEPTLRKLVRLPWFRRGAMPDWLRAALIRRMGKPFRKQVRNLLETLLSPPTAPEESDAVKRTALEVILRREHERGVEEDEVLLAFLWGTKPTGLVQPASALRRLLFHRGRVWQGLRPAVTFVVAAALSGGIWWIMGLRAPVPAQQTLAGLALDIAVSQSHNPVYFAANYKPGVPAQFPMWCYDVAALVLGVSNPYSPAPTFAAGQPRTGEISQTMLLSLGNRAPAQGVSVDSKGNIYIADSGSSRILTLDASQTTLPSPGDLTPAHGVANVGIVADGVNALVFLGGRVVPSQFFSSSLYAVVRSPVGAPPAAPLPPTFGISQAKINPKDGLTYVWIPPGTFMMGCSPGDSECHDDEKPSHQVTITKGFWIGKTDVTQEVYQKVMGQNPSNLKGPSLPAESLSWDEAEAYCQAVKARLPTEAEWEYAARGAITLSRYGPLDDIAWYSGNSGDKTHEVGQKQPNGYGLYDILGNVWQWTSDWYTNYSAGPASDPYGPAQGKYRTLRGGSYASPTGNARVSSRSKFTQGYGSSDMGFRCVVE